MHFFIYVYIAVCFVLLKILLIISIIISICHLNADSAKTEINLSEDPVVLDTLPHSSQYSCVANCKLDHRCKSISFDRRTLECHLLGAAGKTPRTMEDGENFSDMSKWKDSISGQCKTSPCMSGDFCWVDRLNRQVCYFSPYCKEFTVRSPAVVKFYETRLTKFAVLYCESGYTNCKGRVIKKCLRNKLWEYKPFGCFKNTWLKPTIPLIDRIPCRLVVGSLVEIIGVPVKKKGAVSRFSISLKRQSQFLFYIDFRFGYKNLIKSALLNYKIGSKWGKGKLIYKNFPLKIGRAFNITVVVYEKHFSVVVDGKSCYRFKHKAPVREVEDFAVKEYVIVRSVSIR